MKADRGQGRHWRSAFPCMTLIALAAGLADGAAAQSNGGATSVTIYGVVDAGYTYQSGSVNNANGTSSGPVVQNALNSGVARGSRVGFRGTEDLGDGMKAVFALEMGFFADTGNFSQGAQVLNQYPAGIAFGRQAFVGLKNDRFGSLTMGRQYTPHFTVTTMTDPFFQGTAGTLSNLQNTTARSNNSVIYLTPSFGGLTASAMYSFGEVAGDSSKSRQYSGNLIYSKDKLQVGVGYFNMTNAQGTASNRTTTIGGNYDADFAILYTNFQMQRSNLDNPPGSVVLGADRTFTNYNSFLIGVTVPFGRHQVMASYIHNTDIRGGGNRDADQFAIGYRYNFSKRTYLYSTYGMINNHNGASYTIGDALYVNGNARKAFNLGVSHDF